MSRSYYPPDPYAVSSGQQYPPPHPGGSYSSQHNHPTSGYYPPDPSTTYYDQQQPPPSSSQQLVPYQPPQQPPYQQQSSYQQEPMYGTATSSYYGTTSAPAPAQPHGPEVSQYSSTSGPPPPPPPLSSFKKPSPFGATGPYGIDATNSSMDYYRKLYYPYDPITGEYMKDATPPGDSLGPPFPPTESTRPYQSTSGYSAAMGNSALAADGLNGYATSGQMMNAASMSQYPYQIQSYHGQNGSLLCCDIFDFMCPRPSINCMIITLFAILVLVIIFSVVKFLMYFPGIDKTHDDTVAMVDQITIILLIAAVIALVYIFFVYFTSRRIRNEISQLLSCAGQPPDQTSSSYARRMMRAGYPPPGMASMTTSGYGGYGNTTLVNDMQYSTNPYQSRPGRSYDSGYAGTGTGTRSNYQNYL